MSNQDQQPPWGKKHKPQTPEEVVAQLINKLQDFFSDQKKPPPSGDGPPPNENPISPFANIGKILTVFLIILIVGGFILPFLKLPRVKWVSSYDSASTLAPRRPDCILRSPILIPSIKLTYRISVKKSSDSELVLQISRRPSTDGDMKWNP